MSTFDEMLISKEKVYGKSNFAEASKNLIKYKYENIVVIDLQNNYVEIIALMTMLQKILHSSNSLSVLHNYLISKQNYFHI